MSRASLRGRIVRTLRGRGPLVGTTLAAVGFGLLAVFGVRGHVAGQLDAERARLLPAAAREHVVVAKHDLPAGSVIGPDSMALRELNTEGLPASAVRPEAFESVMGARLAAPLQAGEPLLAALVVQAREDELAGKVRNGVRALTISVDEVNALSGMLQPGDRIDLLLSARLPFGIGRSGQASGQASDAQQAASEPADVTLPLMQDVLVLATGRQVRAGSDVSGETGRAFTSITIETTPEQAQRLVVAQRTGRLTALLRNPGDRGAMAHQAMDLAGLLGAAPRTVAPTARAAATATTATEIIIGGRGSLERSAQPMSARSADPGSAMQGVR